MENVIKECEEEASMPRELAATARPVGFVSYMNVSALGEWDGGMMDVRLLFQLFGSTFHSMAAGLKPDVLFTFDIKVPETFVPKPLDGEVRRLKQEPGYELRWPAS